MTAEETKKDNEKRLLLAIGLMLMGKDADIGKVEDVNDLPADVQTKASEVFKSRGLEKLAGTEEPLSKEQVLRAAAEVEALENGVEYFKIVSVGDGRVCEYCKEWEGKIVTMSGDDPRYKRLDDFLNSPGAHFGCRCYLQPYTPKKLNTKDLNKMAMNSEFLKDTVVYRGFVDESYGDEVEYDFDETLVMITPLGEFVGSNADGKPTKEIIDEQSIIEMAKQTEEVLLDKDHASMRPIGERNTEAMGWISGFKAITGLGSMNGLYGVIRWAGEGMRLVKDRVYRFLSPVFKLDSDGRAIQLINVALTNRPALRMPPILNSQDNENDISITSTVKDTDTMNRDELVALIDDMVNKAMSQNSCADEEEKSEVKNEDTPAEENKVEETKEESSEEEKTEVKNEDTPAEENKVEETKEESSEEVKEEEVIKEESLNSQPTIGVDISGKDEWMNLKGAAFFKYLKEHPELRG